MWQQLSKKSVQRWLRRALQAAVVGLIAHMFTASAGARHPEMLAGAAGLGHFVLHSFLAWLFGPEQRRKVKRQMQPLIQLCQVPQEQWSVEISCEGCPRRCHGLTRMVMPCAKPQAGSRSGAILGL